LRAVTGPLEPAEAARLLTQALGKTSDSSAHVSLALGLVEVAGRMSPPEAIGLLTQTLGRESDITCRVRLTEGLVTAADRLGPAEAARAVTEAAGSLGQALDLKDLSSWDRTTVARSLAALAGRLEPADATRACARAARRLIQALDQETDADRRRALAEGLAALAERLGPAEAARTCTEAARLLTQALKAETDRHKQLALESAAAALIQQVDRELAMQFAPVFAQRITSEADANYQGFGFRRGGTLAGVLSAATRPEIRRRTAAVGAAAGAAAGGVVPAIPAIRVAGEPLPCRLSTQELVELLKMPTCVGEVRRVVLAHLGHRYGRRFATHWQFIRYAQENGLNLDFTTPPRRPPTTLPPLFEP
jgi:hypothetical protein